MWKRSELPGIAAAANELLAEVAADDWGQVAVSLYDTARLVTLAPWLSRHHARLEFLCRSQDAAGGWGGPDGYAVLPTLSATAALLAELRQGVPAGEQEQLVRAANGGVNALRRWLDPDAGLAVPDTIAVELIVPALMDELNDLLTEADPTLLGTSASSSALVANSPRTHSAGPLGRSHASPRCRLGSTSAIRAAAGSTVWCSSTRTATRSPSPTSRSSTTRRPRPEGGPGSRPRRSAVCVMGRGPRHPT